MSWHSKVVWNEGVFLRQHHLQQHDRYFEHLLETRVRQITPYPWGFSDIEIDTDLSQQNKFGLRRAAGIFQDGTPFDLPATSPLPVAVDVPDNSERKFIWLTIPAETANARETDMARAGSGSRYFQELESVVDSASSMHVEEDITVAHPRIEIAVRETPKPGYHNLCMARIMEVRDKKIIFDNTFAPPVLTCQAHTVVNGWIDRVIGWVETRLEMLARYAADFSSGGGFQAHDYFMLHLLNREINVWRHFKVTKYLHPETLYVALMRLSGELATFSPTRIAPAFPPYDHDRLPDVMEPPLAFIQRMLSLDTGRAIHLDLTEVRQNAFLSNIKDRSLFHNARLIIEVSADMPLGEIQRSFPALCKIGPNTKMSELVQTNLPGITVVHMPTPPREIRLLTDHLYFQLDRNSPLWPEFSVAAAIGLHFAGNWPGLQLDLWAIVDSQ